MRWKYLGVTLTTFVIFWFCRAIYNPMHTAPAYQNAEHVRLAWAILHGHLYVDGMAPWEHVNVLGHDYELHPPLAAILCLPFVALHIYNQTLISVFYGSISVGLCARFIDCIHRFHDQQKTEEYQQRDDDGCDDHHYGGEQDHF